MRLGDVLAAVIVFIGTSWLSLQPRGFALINAVMVAIWLVIAWRIGRQYQELSITKSHPATAA